MDIKESSRSIASFLDLQRNPVGIKFLFSKESFDVFPAAASDYKFTYCTGIKMASLGKKVKMHEGHHACSGGASALGFLTPTEDTLSGERRQKIGCYGSIEASKKVTEEMIYCQRKPYGIGLMPLAEYDDAPDVVLMVVSSYNAMRIIQGYSYHHGFCEGLKTVGLQAVCHDCTSFPFETGHMNMTLFCSGTRMIAHWGRDEIGIGIPWKYWEDIVDGVEKTINPFERDKDKKEIIKRIEKNQIEKDSSEIQLGKNYDDGCYIGGRVK